MMSLRKWPGQWEVETLAASLTWEWSSTLVVTLARVWSSYKPSSLTSVSLRYKPQDFLLKTRNPNIRDTRWPMGFTHVH